MIKSDLRRFCVEILTAAGADRGEAEIVARILVWSDSAGRTTQGVWRLPILTDRLKKGLYQSPCELEFNMNTAVLGRVNADNGLAHYVTHQVTQHAIKTARDEGICAMTINHSNYYGAGGYYAKLIADAGMIGMVMSNSYPKVIPYGGVSPALGTNPFSFSCPATQNKHLLIDMSTSEVSGSSIRKSQEDTVDVLDGLIKFTDTRGYGLSLFVEVMAGVLSGAGISHEVNSMYNNFEEGGNNGHFIFALNINNFMPIDQFILRVQDLIEYLKTSGSNVQYPGENRWRFLEKSERDGITLDTSTIQALQDLANEFDIPFGLTAG